MERIILHSDLNSFYATVEIQRHPSLISMPVAVCGDVEERRGIILTKNEIAKSYGVKTAEAIWCAKLKCPDLVTIKADFSLYSRYSKRVRAIYLQYTDQVETFGIDEAWLDITHSIQLFGSAQMIATAIIKQIYTELGITVSVGISYNKIFAKLGSDIASKSEIITITPENRKEMIDPLPASALLYVGRSTYKKMLLFNIKTIGDLAQTPHDYLQKHFGKWGSILWRFANGYDSSPVSKFNIPPLVKSIGNSTTAPRDLNTLEEVTILFHVLGESVATRLKEQGLKCKTVSIYLRDNQLFSFSRQVQLANPSNLASVLVHAATDLCAANYDFSIPLRSIGIKASNLILTQVTTQLSLFNDLDQEEKLYQLETAIEVIRNRFGYFKIQKALMLCDPKISHFNPKEDHVIFPESYFKGGTL